MKHYMFYFDVSITYRDNDNHNKRKSPKYNKTIDRDDIIEWYKQFCNPEVCEFSNGFVRYDASENSYVLEFDTDASYEDAKFEAEIVLDPDSDWNYPLYSNGKNCYISGELDEELSDFMYHENHNDNNDHDNDDDDDDNDHDDDQT